METLYLRPTSMALEPQLSDEPDPDEAGGAADPGGPIELDICADSPLRIESTADGGLRITCWRLDGRSRMVTMLLRFTPAAAANLIGGLYRAVQAGAVNVDEQDPPPH
jgi:hypothetical protein